MEQGSGRRGKKTSVMWNHFARIGNSAEFARCIYCEAKVSYRSSVSNLKKHILRKHSEVLDKNNKNDRDDDDDGIFATSEAGGPYYREVEVGVGEDGSPSEVATYDVSEECDSRGRAVKKSVSVHPYEDHDAEQIVKKSKHAKDESINHSIAEFLDITGGRLPEQSRKKILNSDSLVKFFFSMCGATQCLPRLLQIEVKEKIFRAVNDAESVAVRNVVSEANDSLPILNYRDNFIVQKKNYTNSLDKFFSAMCEMTVALPSHLQIQVKKQVFEAVSSAEESSLADIESAEDQNKNGEIEIVQFGTENENNQPAMETAYRNLEENDNYSILHSN